MRLYEIQSLDVPYYMEEACGIYAMALSNINPGGFIFILSDDYGDEWSSSIPYEITHVFYSLNNELFDAKGKRTIQSMAEDFNLLKYSIKGPFHPNEFYQRFMGSSNNKPLYGNKADIKKCIQEIKSIISK